jgi:uncharacterized protein
MTAALAIFAKTPGLSSIKSRLAAEIGIELAEQFYCRSVRCIEDLGFGLKNSTNGNLVPSWAVGEVHGLDHHLWQNFERQWTGSGGLGERLDCIYSTLLEKYEHVIIIGTDSPQLRAEDILSAHEYLKKNTGFVVGPADDGGYYLFGGNRHLPRDLWTSVSYSVATTCRDFILKLKSYGEVSLLERNFDIDTYEDINKLRQCEMSGSAQIQLLSWLDGNLR